MRRISGRAGRRLWFALALTASLLFLAGCNDSDLGTIYPVSGKITLKGELFTAETTTVLFQPDVTKDNPNPLVPVGTVDADGVYTLTVKGHKGAPPGRYRVIVTATSDKLKPSPDGARKHCPVPESLVPEKYGTARTTPLLIEVVEKPEPGAYDLKLTE